MPRLSQKSRRAGRPVLLVLVLEHDSHFTIDCPIGLLTKAHALPEHPNENTKAHTYTLALKAPDRSWRSNIPASPVVAKR
jgi:hypothetical protein